MQLTSITLTAALVALLSSSPLAVVAAPSANALANAVASPDAFAEPAAGPVAVDAPLDKRSAIAQDNSGDDEGDNGVDGADVVDVELATPELVARATRHCANNGRIKRNKSKYKGKCQKKDSIGYFSSHNCANRGGKSYLCVQGQKATCYSTNLRGLNFENGECFK
jgi:hypothetical protein